MIELVKEKSLRILVGGARRIFLGGVPEKNTPWERSQQILVGEVLDKRVGGVLTNTCRRSPENTRTL